MTPEDQKELNRLCLLVMAEKDPAKLTKLVEDLNAFLKHSEQARRPKSL